MLAVRVGQTDPKGRTRKQARDRGKALAGKSAPNRLELSSEDATAHPYKKIGRDKATIDGLMVDVFLQAHRRAPRQIILDLDAADDPIHGSQEGCFFHGYYRQCYYLPCVPYQHDHHARQSTPTLPFIGGVYADAGLAMARIRGRRIHAWPECWE
jgi:hypothetical protein